MAGTREIHEARILIVDDEPANVLLLERTLRKAGYSALWSVTDPRRAMALYREVRPDLVILDVNMPEINGLELLVRLNEEIGTGTYLPVLVMTSDVQPEVKLDALTRGAKDFLIRPLDLNEVMLRVRNLIETRFLVGDRPRDEDGSQNGLSVYFHCRSCGGEHPAPIQFADRFEMLRTHLASNIFECPLKQVSARYSKQHLIWKGVR